LSTTANSLELATRKRIFYATLGYPKAVCECLKRIAKPLLFFLFLADKHNIIGVNQDIIVHTLKQV